jgi:hypothetical protein
VPVWNELPPVVTYGEWGACTPNQRSFGVTANNGSSCSQSQTVRTVINEQNSCTGEVRVKSDTTTSESRPCECVSACDTDPATSGAAQGFSLANSGEATETAWVNANVDPGPYEFIRKDEFNDNGSCLTAIGAAKVVLVKAGTSYHYYLNVTTGQSLCSDNGRNISHISYFNCQGDD